MYINSEAKQLIDTFKNEFNTILKGRYQTINDDPNYTPQSDFILSQWYDAKCSFIRAFDGKLIYDAGKQTFQLDEMACQTKLHDFIKLIKNSYEEYDLASFVKQYRDCFFTTQKTNSEYNQTVGIKNEGLVSISIPKGTKIIKAFKYFIKDPTTLNFLQTRASMLIQEDKISGHLYLSVHPLDYLSLSENTNKWRSCHALDGDYCAGNLSYMCDQSTIVCYLCGDNEKELPHFNGVKWNSKKWRMLLFVSQDNNLIFAGRHYPFFSRAIMDKIKEVYTWLYKTPVHYSPWSDYQLTELTVEHEDSVGFRYNTYETVFNPQMFINNYLVPPYRIIKDMSDLHYNDLLNSTVYTPYYAYTDQWSYERGTVGHILVGSSPDCPYCGKRMLYNSGEMACSDCRDEFDHWEVSIGRCACCDREIYEGEDYYFNHDVEGEIFCTDCANYELIVCEDCGRYYNKEFITEVTDSDGITHAAICPSCLLKYQTLEEENPNGERSTSEE